MRCHTTTFNVTHGTDYNYSFFIGSAFSAGICTNSIELRNRVPFLLYSSLSAFRSSLQEKHAVIMVRFAAECLDRMRALVSSLSLCLGPETAGLELRVGLHSGPVTGGVLRGQKSRFQLFGPTMNQASRMESTGVPGRIQVSAETAQELSLYNKSHWLMERLDKIEAKGLGELTTYWVNIMESALPNKEDSSASLSRLSRQQPPLPQQQHEHRRENSPSCSASYYGGQCHL